MEKRRYKRVNLHGEVEGHVILASGIQIKDLSIGGMLFESTRRFNPGSRCNLIIEHSGRRINLHGRVVRAVLQRTRKERGDVIPVYGIAVEFEPMTESTRAQLQDLIERFSHEGTEGDS